MVRATAGEGRPRVLIVVENLPVPFDPRVWREATALTQGGWDVTVICPMGRGSDAAVETIDGISILRHEVPPEGTSPAAYVHEYASALASERRLAKTVWKKRGFDVMHLCNPPDLLFLVALPYMALHGVPMIFDQHDINPELWEAKYERRGPFYWALRVAERVTYALAHTVIATNESYREIAVSRGGKRSTDVFVVRNGPDLRRFKRVPPNPAYRRGRQYLVGFVGVIGEQEGVDGLLRSARHVVLERGRTDVQFCIIGDGPAAHQLRELCPQLGVADHVEFTGHISDEEMIERLCTCDVCVNPDPWTPFNDKSTMNKVLEYMALAKPIVQYDLVEGKRSAADASLYVTRGDEEAFGDSIIGLLDDPALRERMGEAGYLRMTRSLDWEHQIPNLLTAYAHCAQKRPKGSVQPGIGYE